MAIKEPIILGLFVIYIVAAILAIGSGGFLISASMKPASMMDVSTSLSEEGEEEIFSENETKDITEIQRVSVILGSLSILFSTFFIWAAIEIGIIYFGGQNEKDFCLCDRIVKNQTRQKIWEK